MRSFSSDIQTRHDARFPVFGFWIINEFENPGPDLRITSDKASLKEFSFSEQGSLKECLLILDKKDFFPEYTDVQFN